MRKGFAKDELEKVFSEIGSRLSKPVGVFLLGGGAMCFRNQKVATKDLDLIFKAKTDSQMFIETIGTLGFSEKKKIEAAYEEMKAAGIWENREGFRLDLFVRTVCGALSLSDGMVARSELLKEYGKLQVRMVSNEDVILFKGITERSGDEEDVIAIIRSADIDWNIVFGECAAQSGKRHWYGPLYNKLMDIEEKRGIAVPITKTLLKLDRQVILKNAFESRVQKGMSREEAIADLRKLGFTKKELSVF